MPQRTKIPFFAGTMCKWNVTPPFTLIVLNYLPALEFMLQICQMKAVRQMRECIHATSLLLIKVAALGVLVKNKVPCRAGERAEEVRWSMLKSAGPQLAPTGLRQCPLDLRLHLSTSCVFPSLKPKCSGLGWEDGTLYRTRGIVSPQAEMRQHFLTWWGIVSWTT